MQRKFMIRFDPEFKDKKIKASNLISVDLVKHYLEKLGTDLSKDDFTNLKLRFEKQKRDDKNRFIRFYKPRDEADEDL